MINSDDLSQRLAALSPEDRRALLTRLVRGQQQNVASERWEPLSENQKALWFHAALAPESSAYNMLYSMRIREAMDLPALQVACQKLAQHHPILSATFALHAGEPALKFSHVVLFHLRRLMLLNGVWLNYNNTCLPIVINRSH